MFRRCVTVILTAAACLSLSSASISSQSRYDDLVQLFVQWREFQKPKLVDGVPDYSARAMEAGLYPADSGEQPDDGLATHGTLALTSDSPPRPPKLNT